MTKKSFVVLEESNPVSIFETANKRLNKSAWALFRHSSKIQASSFMIKDSINETLSLKYKDTKINPVNPSRKSKTLRDLMNFVNETFEDLSECE